MGPDHEFWLWAQVSPMPGDGAVTEELLILPAGSPRPETLRNNPVPQPESQRPRAIPDGAWTHPTKPKRRWFRRQRKWRFPE